MELYIFLSVMTHPQQNRAAERKNRHLLKVGRALMFTKSVPKIYWSEAFLTATYLINRTPSKVLDMKTPINLLKAKFPHTNLFGTLPLKIFRCVAYVHIQSIDRSKLD